MMVIQHRHSELTPEDAKASGCDGKQVFPNWALAQKKARWMTRRDGSEGICKPYRCHNCGLIHIGSVSREQHRVSRFKRLIRRRVRRGEPSV